MNIAPKANNYNIIQVFEGHFHMPFKDNLEQPFERLNGLRAQHMKNSSDRDSAIGVWVCASEGRYQFATSYIASRSNRWRLVIRLVYYITYLQ